MLLGENKVRGGKTCEIDCRSCRQKNVTLSGIRVRDELSARGGNYSARKATKSIVVSEARAAAKKGITVELRQLL